jgi:beta-lactamase regulating signal transducer with metallopeptidase domain
LAAGLAASVLLRRRPVRAHQLLLLSLIAAILIPTLSHAVKQNKWGLFVAERTVSIRKTQPFTIQTDPTTAAPAPGSNTPTEPAGAIVTASETAAPATPRFQWQTALPLLWLGATSALLLRLMARLLLGLCLVRRSTLAQSRPIAEALDGAKAKLSVEGDVIVRASPQTPSPVIWCWGRRPVLLVPRSSCLDGRLDWLSILCHELAHWKRHDHISSLLAELMICLLPWQPLFWLARRRLVDLSEEACDDWVIASGQVGTHYARTLLGLTPLGQAALVPAVVTTRTGLTGRIRRILEDKCSNPRSGLKWTLAAVTLTACLAVTIAFAQTRLAEQAATIKTKTGRLTSIEQLTSGTVIKGRVFDPNGEPARSARLVVLPITISGTTVSSLRHEDGYFELPWSPTWADDSQNPLLWVTDDRQGREAVLVEIADPTASVAVHLKPAATITGQVVDPAGQPLDGRMILSLAQAFRCPAPLYFCGTNPDLQGKFSFSLVPYGHTYSLSIRADGYQPTEVLVDTTDASVRTIDIGAIVLQPQEPAKPVAAQSKSSDPDLEKEFREMYRLDKGEVIKCIKAPFVLGREQYFRAKGESSYFSGTADGYWSYGYLWDGQAEAYSGTTGALTISNLLRVILCVPRYDFQVPEELQQVCVPRADFVIRKDSSLDDRLKALEEIIYAELHRAIRFEKRTVERKTVVVTGDYSFTPIINEHPEWICVFVNRNEMMAGGGGEVDSLTDLFRHIGNDLHVAFEVRTEQTKIPRIWCQHSSEFDINGARDENLPLVLDNLSRQTGLKLTVETLPAEVWFATENTGD